MDGYEAGRRLRRALGPELLLVAMTGYGTDQDRRRSAEAGFDSHLVKPVPPQRLEEILAGMAGTKSPAPNAKSNNLAAGAGR
jgi:CheY-like chemotaxis protein